MSNNQVTVQPTNAGYVVRTGTQGPPGSAGDFFLVDLADIQDPGQIDDGALLIFDKNVQQFRLLTTVEQDQIINGGYF